MRPDVVALLRCPHCGEGLSAQDGALRCAAGHSFDIARQGYVNLLPGNARTGTADSTAMVAAREDFLNAGHFAGLRCTIVRTAIRFRSPDRGGRSAPYCVIDAGAGTGYYLAGVLEQLPHAIGLALDLSKHALRRAAKAGARIGAVACDVWRGLPVGDACADLMLDIFAPRNGPEFHRILRPNGHLIIVTPTSRHLHELVSSLDLVTVDPRKQERVDATLAGLFTPVESRDHEEKMALDHHEIVALVSMGPSARHVAEPHLLERLRTLPPVVTVTLSATVHVYRPLP